MKMPEMDGCEIVRLIKSFDRSIPVIAVTAYDSAVEKQRIFRQKFENYVSKPVNSGYLLNVISRYVKSDVL